MPSRGRDDTRTIGPRYGQVLTLDEASRTPAALLALWTPCRGQPFRSWTHRSGASARSTALKRVLLRESQEQPLLLVFEDLHWIDAETQALLDSLVESLPTAACCCWSTTGRSTSTAGAARRTTRNCGSTPAARQRRRSSCRPCWGRPSLAPLTPL
jgi:hypothetical protein